MHVTTGELRTARALSCSHVIDVCRLRGLKSALSLPHRLTERSRQNFAAQTIKYHSTAVHSLEKHANMTSTSLLTQLADLLAHNNIT